MKLIGLIIIFLTCSISVFSKSGIKLGEREKQVNYVL